MFLLVSSWQNETSLMLVPLENIVWPACKISTILPTLVGCKMSLGNVV